MNAVIYPGYWVDPHGYLRYVLGFLTAVFVTALVLVLGFTAALVRGGDERVTPKRVRRGRGVSVLQGSTRVRDISLPDRDAVGALRSRVSASSAPRSAP